MTPVTSTAWAASKVVTTTPGRLLGLSVRIASPGTYYLIVLDATSVPADSTDVTGASYTRITVDAVTTTGTNEMVSIDYTVGGGHLAESQAGVKLTSGCVVLLSSTAPSSVTGVASGMWVSLAELG